MSDPRSRSTPDPEFDPEFDPVVTDPAVGAYDQPTDEPWPVAEVERPGSYAGSTAADSGGTSTTDAAKEQGSRLADEAAGGGQHVAQVAKEQASSVASEAGTQARNLLGEAKSQLSSQASDQKGSLVSYLKAFGDDLDGMVSGRAQGSDDQHGPARALAQRASGYAQNAAGWLEDREPSEILDEVSRFARRRPGLFLVIAAAAGVLAGRLTRGLTSGDDDSGSSRGAYGPSRTAYSTGAPVPAPGTGYATEEYAGSGYSTGGLGYDVDEVDEVRYSDEGFGLPDAQTGRTAAPGEPGYDDRSAR